MMMDHPCVPLMFCRVQVAETQEALCVHFLLHFRFDP